MSDKRKKLLGILLVVVTIFAFVVMLFAVFIRPSLDLHERATATRGLPKSIAIERLGIPWKSYSYREFASRHLNDLSHSYNPDPPDVQCDEVLIYSVLASMEILYVRDGIVVHVHSCAT